MNFWDIIFLFFAFQAVVLSILFFSKKKGDKTSNILLGTYVLLFGYNIFYNVLFWTRLIYSTEFIFLLFTSILIWVLYGPILFFYVRRVVLKKRFKVYDLVHFIPFSFFLVNYSKGYFMSAQKKQELLTSGNWSGLMYHFSPYFTKIIMLLMITYFIVIFFDIKNNLKSLNKSRWLSWLVFSFLGYIITFSIYFIFRSFGIVAIENDYIATFSMIFFVGLLSYFGFMQPDVFNGLSMDKLIPFKKYQKTGLTKNHSLELKERLVRLMTSEKPYLNSELRLDDLSIKLNLARHHMSQVINEHFDLSFFDFVNKYRIEEAKKMLIDNDTSLSITDILYSSGFNNRVSFYKAFKKDTGVTPSKYRSTQNKAS